MHSAVCVIFLYMITRELYGQIIPNVALRKSAIQYNGTKPSTTTWPANNAINGVLGCETADLWHLSVSAYGPNPWWQVDLLDIYDIQRIVVHGRTDNSNPEQLTGFHVYISTSEIKSKDGLFPIYKNTEYNGSVIQIENINQRARFCRLEIPNINGLIALCEVAVHGMPVKSLLQIHSAGLNPEMTSTFESWTAAKAIDNNPSQNADACLCCSATDDDVVDNQWWKINLLKKYRVSMIEVYGRTGEYSEQSSDLDLFIGNGTDLGDMERSVKYNDNVYTINYISAVTFQYFGIRKRTKVLTVCEVKLFEVEPNVVQRNIDFMNATMSSTYGQWVANNAIDNVPSAQHIDTCSCCSATSATGTGTAWWQLDLGKQYLVSHFKVVGRNDSTEQSANFSFAIHNSSMSSTHDGENVDSYRSQVNYVYTITFTQDHPRLLQNIIVSRGTASLMAVCEVMVFDTECQRGTFGDRCSNKCGHCLRGSCDSTTGFCTCTPGWHGNTCNMNIDECSTNKHNCSTHGVCTDTPGSFVCSCQPGYTGNGYKCSDIDECMKLKTCHTDANCTNSQGSYSCACNTGFSGNGNSCSDIDECSTNPGACHTNATCTNTKGSYACSCKHGFTGNDHQCVDVDECNAKPSPCDDLATCRNGIGSYECKCNTGYNGNGKFCNDINECQTDLDACPSNAICRNTIGSHNCTCKTGYLDDRGACKDKDECEEKPCDMHANCTNTMGSFRCNCQNGYTPHNSTACIAPQSTVKTSSQGDSPTTGIVVGTAAAVLVILALLIVGVIFFKRRQQTKTKAETSPGGTLFESGDDPDALPEPNTQYTNKAFAESETSTPNLSSEYYNFGDVKNVPGIKIHELWDYIRERAKKGNNYFTKEFAKLESGLTMKHDIAANPANRTKNRYKEMYAYDHSRVPLTKETEGESDYINACYIDGYGKLKQFIASQGPTKSMIGDFWRMVWQQNTDKIVMLTKLIEMAAQKCLQYWPDRGDECSFGNIHIKLDKEEQFTDYVIRTLDVRKGDTKLRKIRQFHFKAWPDKDVPDNSWCLVDFWRAVDANADTTGPIVVHCSAGVGRTGTFIAMDLLVAQAKAERCVRPLQIVETLRRQRINMVQTKDQYVYLHEALAEALLIGTHSVAMRHFDSVYKFLTQTENGSSKIRLENQFELIERGMELQPIVPDSEEYMYSNVATANSEGNAYQPQLKKRGSDLVNQLGSYFLPNFEGKNTFLVMVSPNENNLEDFWSLIEEQHIITVIMLTSKSDDCYKGSAHLGGRSGKPVGRYAVNHVQERKQNCFIEKSFSFRDTHNEDEDYLTTVKQFEFLDWKDGEDMPSSTMSILDLLEAVQRWHPHLTESKPILIHCGTGSDRSGIVAVLLNELQRMKKNGSQINIVETVKTMKQRKRNIIHNCAQFRYCYDVLETYVKQSDIYQNL